MTHSNETRIETLLRKMTRKEKVALLSSEGAWRTILSVRLGIPSVTRTDGPPF